MTTPRPGNTDTPDTMSAVSELIPIAEIGELKAEDYVGLIDREAIESLKVRLAAEGLHTPIWLRRNGNAWKGARYSVIAGRHRLIAASELGWTEIAAEVRAGPDSKPDRIKALQLIENLDRRIPRPIERACLIMERWRVVAATINPSVPANQQAAAARKRWSAPDNAGVFTTTVNALDIDKGTALAVGETSRAVGVYRRLFERLVTPFPDQFALINAHPLGESLAHMQTLAAVPLSEFPKVDSRREAVNQLLTSNDWPNMEAVLRAAKLHESTGNRAKPEAKFQAIWNGFDTAQKRSHFEAMARDIPYSVVRDVIEALKVLLP